MLIRTTKRFKKFATSYADKTPQYNFKLIVRQNPFYDDNTTNAVLKAYDGEKWQSVGYGTCYYKINYDIEFTIPLSDVRKDVDINCDWLGRHNHDEGNYHIYQTWEGRQGRKGKRCLGYYRVEKVSKGNKVFNPYDKFKK